MLTFNESDNGTLRVDWGVWLFNVDEIACEYGCLIWCVHICIVYWKTCKVVETFRVEGDTISLKEVRGCTPLHWGSRVRGGARQVWAVTSDNSVLVLSH